mmetsp:Transcript_16662/g.40852  ORF Transcript_16662/g.40852 Transcript_16662/m.40852 type:complete len:301 (+) Transcript_16662:194-1096(+)
MDRPRLGPGAAVDAEEVVDVREGGLLHDHLVGVEDVVHVEVRDVGLHHGGHVARGERHGVRRALGDDVRLLPRAHAPLLQRVSHRPRLGHRQLVEVVHHDHAHGGALKGGGHRQTTLLLVHLDGPVPRLGSEDDTTTGLEGRAAGAGARVPRPLLLEWLLATTPDLRLRESARGAPARVLPDHDDVLVHDTLGDLAARHLEVQRHGAGLLTLERELLHVRRQRLHAPVDVGARSPAHRRPGRDAATPDRPAEPAAHQGGGGGAAGGQRERHCRTRHTDGARVCRNWTQRRGLRVVGAGTV